MYETKMSFIEVDISHRTAPLRVLYIVTLNYIFKVIQVLEIIIYNIWKTVRANEKCSSMAFIEVGIRFFE